MKNFVKTKIDLNPCDVGDLKKNDTTVEVEKIGLRNFFSTEKITLTRSGSGALQIVLRDILALKKEDTVTILKSLSDFNDHYVSACVTNVIEEFCNWSQTIEDSTKVILVIHEFGYPFDMERMSELRSKYIIIEDCAYALGTTYKGEFVGQFSDYSIFSFPKIFPIGFGGALLGVKESNNNLLSINEDHINQTLSFYFPTLQEIIEKRNNVWNEMREAFQKIGFSPAMPLAQKMNPGVFLLDCNTIKKVSLEKLEKIKSALQEFGIENTIYYPTFNMILPCHQDLTKEMITYIVDTFHSTI